MNSGKRTLRQRPERRRVIFESSSDEEEEYDTTQQDVNDAKNNQPDTSPPAQLNSDDENYGEHLLEALNESATILSVSPTAKGLSYKKVYDPELVKKYEQYKAKMLASTNATNSPAKRENRSQQPKRRRQNYSEDHEFKLRGESGSKQSKNADNSKSSESTGNIYSVYTRENDLGDDEEYIPNGSTKAERYPTRRGNPYENSEISASNYPEWYSSDYSVQ